MGAIIISILLLQPSAPKATSGARCQLYVIGASMKKAPLPKELARFKALFSRMPFKMYKGFRLRNTRKVLLAQGRSAVHPITGREFVELTLRKGEMRKGRRWYDLRFTIYRKEKKGAKKINYDMVVKIMEGKPMFVAGPEDKEETIFVGVVCR